MGGEVFVKNNNNKKFFHSKIKMLSLIKTMLFQSHKGNTISDILDEKPGGLWLLSK